ncbi:MAG: hypothetical protein R3C97_06620 [Geminicoccaceae bacterium]
MNIVSNLNFRWAIVLIVLPPLLATIFFGARSSMDDWKQSKAMAELSDLVNLSFNMGHLVHEQQIERGASFVYMSSAGRVFRDELAVLRRQTDVRREEFEASVASFDLAGLSRRCGRRSKRFWAACR